MLLIAIAVIGAVAATSLETGAQVSRRDAEEHLLWIGMEYENALRAYSATSGGLLRVGPRVLDDLLRDPRFPEPRRYLRQLYLDPLTGKHEWGIVRNPEGYIIGIYSLSGATPIRHFGFDKNHAQFEKATSYQEWIFGLAPVVNNVTLRSSSAGALE